MSLEPSFVVFALCVFLAVVLLLEGLWNLWATRHSPAARRLSERLAAVADRGLSEAKAAEISALMTDGPDRSSWLSRLPAGRRLENWVQAGGTAVDASDLLKASLLASLVAGTALALAAWPAWVVLPCALAACAVPWVWMAVRRERRMRRIEEQFPQALDLLARALRAGHALPAAVGMAAQELPHPLVRDYRRLFEEMNYGVPVDQALARFAQRLPLADASYFAVAVTLQRESGGNLAEVLDQIARLVRERLRLRGEVRTLSAEGRLSAVILTALPFGVGAVVQAVNPRFLSVLWSDPAGQRMVGLALTGIVVGVLWMRSIIRIRV